MVYCIKFKICLPEEKFFNSHDPGGLYCDDLSTFENLTFLYGDEQGISNFFWNISSVIDGITYRPAMN